MQCTKNAIYLEKSETNAKLLTIKSFERYGRIHNEVLTTVNENYAIPENIEDYKSGLNDIGEFITKSLLESELVKKTEKAFFINKNFSQKFTHFIDNRILVHKLIKYDSFLSKRELTLSSMPQNRNYSRYLDSVDFNFYEKIDSALLLGMIDRFEYDNLKLIVYKSCENMLGLINEAELYNCIIEVQKEWEKQGYTEDGQFGKVLGVCLAIGIASNDWWQKNPGAEQEEIELKVGLAGDAGGAVVGAVLGGLWNLVTGDNFWDGATGGAVCGAIDGSTGATGKIVRWAKKLWSMLF